MRKQHLNVMLAVPFAASVLGAGEAAAAIPSQCDIAGNLVMNCGFEDTTVWTPSVTQSPVAFAHSGSFAAFLESSGPPTIEQTIM